MEARGAFGVPLEEIMTRPEEKAVIPDIVKKMLLFLNATEGMSPTLLVRHHPTHRYVLVIAINTEGLFRVSPPATRLQETKAACERQGSFLVAFAS